MNHSYELRYKDIVLKPMDEIYSEKYRQLRNQPEIRKWFSFSEEISKEQQEKWYSNYLNNEQDFMFAIVDPLGNFVGANSIYDISEEHTAEFGRIIVDPNYKGRGYGYQAAYAAAKIARDLIGLKELKLEVYSDNMPAIKTYQKVGYQKFGVANDANGREMLLMKLNLTDIND